MDIDDNLTLDADHQVHCRHCAALLGNADSAPLAHALKRERPAVEAGPGVHADPSLYTTSVIVLRQAFCPGCYAVLATEIVPQDDAEFRGWRLQR